MWHFLQLLTLKQRHFVDQLCRMVLESALVHFLSVGHKSLTLALQGLSQIFCIRYAIKFMLSDGSSLLAMALCSLHTELGLMFTAVRYVFYTCSENLVLAHMKATGN